MDKPLKELIFSLPDEEDLDSFGAAWAERGKVISAREQTAIALDELGTPLQASEVLQYAATRFDAPITRQQLAGACRSERRASISPCNRRQRYIVQALEGEGFTPMRGKLALSDWDLERRIVGPWSDRVDHLHTTVQLARNVVFLRTYDPERAQAMWRLLLGTASSVSGKITPSREMAPEAVLDVVVKELDQLEEKDRDWRHAAAIRARRILDPEQQRWGVNTPQPVVGTGD